jgi:outer membrane autotransporter protein
LGGNGDAIRFTGTTRGILELQAGSTINGNVTALVARTDDILRLGGDEDDTFDVSEIGGAEKYRNFNIFEKTGASTWTITGQGTNQAAPWDILAGTLLMSEGSDLGDGPVDLIGGTLAGVGTVGATTAAAGTVISPGIPGVNNGIGTLTIDGGYTGAGGLLAIQTVLGGDDSDTDLLAINGGTAGSTFVQVTNLGGGGAQTQEGIKIVDFDADNSGAESSAGTFSLLGDYIVNGEQAVIGGAYAYQLFQGSTSVPDDGDWYLRSIVADDGTPLFQPAAPLYEAYAGTLQAFNQLGTLQQRVGNRSWAGAMGLEQGADAVVDLTGGEPRNSGLWARIEGADGHFEPESSTTGTDYDTSLWRLQAGLDMLITENTDGSLIGGVNVFYGSIDSDVESLSGSGSIDSDGYGVGGTLTWYGNTGFYVDGQAQATWYDSDVTSDQLGALIEDNDGTGYGLSIEAGRKFAIASNWSMTPQAQLAWSSVDYDGFTDGFATDVLLDGSDSLVGRLGITADYEAFGQDASGRVTRSHFYGIGNLYYDFEDGSTVDVAGVSLTSENEALWGGLGIGGTYNWADDKYSVYGEALVKTGLENFGDSHVLYGTVGFRASW